ncbi:MAG: hypothetical protein LBE60_03580 [Microbacterium sp.]|jgi:hypothetical protein|uniref:hypothetical protein n=1 Tax=Microbacterium sp. TaxID=51671 RepID=UPI002816C3F0|nr:hypothetical protein [Microbacterium sp.]MDR2320712.1 hypothetical protein [Microbacterium sp.]
MTHADSSVPGDEQKDAHRRGRRSVVALWLAGVALVLAALLFPLFRQPAFFVVLALAVLTAVAALVLGIRSRAPLRDSATSGWALGLGIAALALDVVLIGAIAIGVLARPQLTQVEVRAQGGPSFTVAFADDAQSYTEDWSVNGWKRFTTTRTSTEIAVTTPAGKTVAPVSCQILWNGTVVVDEKSDSGSVTCRYDAH